MKNHEYENLKKGDTVEYYGFYKNITFIGEKPGKTETIVILEDKNGNRKEIFKSLFITNGTVVCDGN